MTDLFDLASLPSPIVIEELNFETIFADMLEDFRGRAPEYTAILESDPVIKLLEACAYRELLLRQRANDVARRRLLAFARKSDLEHLAAFWGVTRAVVDPGDPLAYPPIPPTYESDERLTLRLRLRIDSSSTAGPAELYRYHALTAHGEVLDAHVYSPEPGRVRVSVLSRVGDGTPSTEVLDAVRDAVGSASVRAINDTVDVVPAVIKHVSITATVKLLPTAPTTLIGKLAADLTTAFAGYRALGKDITQSWIISRLQVDGVHSVTTVSGSTVVADNECATLDAVQVLLGGRDR